MSKKNTQKYKVIKRKSRTIPFGYKISEDTDYIEPIQFELEALEEAKKFLKTCSYREVAIWLSSKTKRYISYVGLRKRVTRDTASKAKEESQDQSQAVG
jgi:hypothetical protein